ncbi:ABC transporter ATP-binding protein [Gluconacetobacter asukensis]|uniref:ABC transporter ATP-binding protein n=2 Tax=Gluconacetobacter asukensis TaxID=1017181 RepID=A0A7W4J2M0_9PROT|nr:ABC transporter ATP-binding protein [Gluconacetobacter asukensis]
MTHPLASLRSDGTAVRGPAVRLEHVSARMSDDMSRPNILEEVSLSLPASSFTTIIGPSGSGKSTLLRMIAGLLQPQAGTVGILGGTPAEARRNRQIGFVFQDPTLLPWRSVLENVRLPLEIRTSSPSKTAHYSPVELLELVGLQGRQNAMPHELSGGMRQRVAIARALVCKPDIILMDEPFGALDEITRDKLNGEVLRIWQETGATIIFVTHSISEAVRLGERVLVLRANPGRIERIVDIDLPRRATADDCESQTFMTYVSMLRRLLETC